MFGILRPCQHTLPPALRTAWMGHLCGLCLALRDAHGHLARVATSYDGLLLSVLFTAQLPPEGTRAAQRAAGPCALRGFRGASVAVGAGARLAATVSLALASARIRDHVLDGDGHYARRPVRSVAGRVADRWARQVSAAGRGLRLDTDSLLAVVAHQDEVERDARPGSDVRVVTAPTETATAQAFAHTAVLAGMPGNADPLREAGRMFGRLGHLLDAVQDLPSDTASGAWNPLTATATSLDRARELCAEALDDLLAALRRVTLTDSRLAHALLAHQLPRSVRHAFRGHVDGPPAGREGQGHGHQGRTTLPGLRHLPPDHGHDRPYQEYPGQGPGPTDPPDTGGPGGPGERSGGGGGSRCGCPPVRNPPVPRGVLAGCGLALWMTCTCQVCCRDSFPGPWSGQPRTGLCESCGPCCEACSCCGNGCSCCGSCSCCSD
ncbi:DUF5685 family protein [Actinoalloteichus spitiensis]|uniref:DUF5685 family protein n=1 Tax=Actinoalloteichus spitiensis TaxID=252394 RepID=UPI0003820C42|nr:DUF5685 family protein [Actinoalloteichus spitiensis]